jgi:hypothetical protein
MGGTAQKKAPPAAGPKTMAYTAGRSFSGAVTKRELLNFEILEWEIGKSLLPAKGNSQLC